MDLWINPQKHTSCSEYRSPSQLTLAGFETPIEGAFKPKNRWLVLAKLIPWDEICNIYLKHLGINN